MSYATAGIGVHQHFVGEWFQKLAGIKMSLVPYRGGAQVINDLIAGHVKIASLGVDAAHPALQGRHAAAAGAIDGGALAGPHGGADFQEAGFKGLVLDQWIGVFAPAGTPTAITARLNARDQQGAR